MRNPKSMILVLGGAILALSLVIWANPLGVGEIIRSSDASINGVAVPEEGTVTPGSVLATGEHGSALVQFSPDTQVNLLKKNFRYLPNRRRPPDGADVVGNAGRQEPRNGTVAGGDAHLPNRTRGARRRDLCGGDAAGLDDSGLGAQKLGFNLAKIVRRKVCPF